ncbi:hypothetical protein [Rubrivirga sp.]|uniref:hypothetical protein n=1 Tax=Rubrivirga sp. TaxID=1885344 RepID=UPI003C70B873
MPIRTVTSTAVALAAIPFAVGTFVWRALSVSHDVSVTVDPFEVDLQLRERNDD